MAIPQVGQTISGDQFNKMYSVGTTVSADQFKQKYGNQTTQQQPQPVTPTQGNPDVGVNGDLFKTTTGKGQMGVNIANAVTSSEQNFGKDIAQGFYLKFGGQNKIDDITKQHLDSAARLTDLIRANRHPEMNKTWTKMAQDEIKGAQDVGGQIIGNVRTPQQIVGDAMGTALDVGLAGTYGKATQGMKSFQLGSKAVQPVVASTVKQGLGQTLKDIGKKTVVNTAKGAGIGYGYDVSQNLQNNKTGADALKPGIGTLTGGAIPAVIGIGKAGMAITKDTAPRFINSLIKPSKANFSYGKDPGRTISELGITGNNLNQFADNITSAKRDVGSLLSESYSHADNQGITIDATEDVNKINQAIKETAKGGKNNQSIVNTLNNIKDALLYEHQVNGDGVIEKIGNKPVDITQLTPTQAFNLKDQIYSMTRFNGTPTDDKTVNSVLKSVAGGLKDRLNEAVKPFSPEIVDLNQKYADLASGEMAVRNREAIVGRQNLIGLKAGGLGTAVGLTSELMGGSPLHAILMGVSATALEKAMESTAVKTRIAAWLGKESSSGIAKVLNKNPQIGTVLLRTLPKFASKLNK